MSVFVMTIKMRVSTFDIKMLKQLTIIYRGFVCCAFISDEQRRFSSS